MPCNYQIYERQENNIFQQFLVEVSKTITRYRNLRRLVAEKTERILNKIPVNRKNCRIKNTFSQESNRKCTADRFQSPKFVQKP